MASFAGGGGGKSPKIYCWFDLEDASYGVVKGELHIRMFTCL